MCYQFRVIISEIIKFCASRHVLGQGQVLDDFLFHTNLTKPDFLKFPHQSLQNNFKTHQQFSGFLFLHKCCLILVNHIDVIFRIMHIFRLNFHLG